MVSKIGQTFSLFSQNNIAIKNNTDEELSLKKLTSNILTI